MNSGPPIQVVHLFPQLDEKLLELLRSLGPEDWNRPTIARLWSIKDVAAHLLDGNTRALSASRDRHIVYPSVPVTNYQELVHYLNELNATWIKAANRLSTSVLIELLEYTGKLFCVHMDSLDPYEDAIFSVAWAGETTSTNWFHMAREYTEKFLHQQQIRDALGNNELITKKFFYPFIDTFMHGLPYTYRNVLAAPGTTVKIVVRTDAGGQWYLTMHKDGWHLQKENTGNIEGSLTLDPDTAWKLFSKGIKPDVAREFTLIEGNADLASKALYLVSVMA